MIAQLRTSALVLALAALVTACAGERGREGAELRDYVPAHQARVMWLMETHRRMMGGDNRSDGALPRGRARSP